MTASECDSGWTLYLQQSYSHYSSPPPPSRSKKSRRQKTIPKIDINVNSYSYEEEEDLSMISDASSGPPHFDKEDIVEGAGVFGYGTYHGRGERNNKQVGILKSKTMQHCYDHEAHLLDDTASSPFIYSPKGKNNIYNGGGIYNDQEGSSSFESLMDYSNSPAFSATHFQQERSSDHVQESYGFLQPPFSIDPYPQNQWS